MKTLRDLVLLVLVFGGIWAAFTFWPGSPEAEDSKNDLTFGQEERLADMMRGQIEAQYDTFEDSTVEANIDIVFQRIIGSLDSASYNYKLKLMDSKDVNAFATFDGDIYLLTGLIDFTERPEEVAAVLAHEIGHHEKQHVQKKLAKELGFTVLLTIMTGGDPGLISEVFKLIMSTQFDRNQEEEADVFAHQLLEKSGINPNHMATFFLRMKREKKDFPSQLQFISTHPANESRIEDALDYETNEDFEEQSFSINWDLIKEKL